MKIWPFRDENDRRLDQIDREAEQRRQARQAASSGEPTPDPMYDQRRWGIRDIPFLSGRSQQQDTGPQDTLRDPTVRPASPSEHAQSFLMNDIRRQQEDILPTPMWEGEPEPDSRAMRYLAYFSIPVIAWVVLGLFGIVPDGMFWQFFWFYILSVIIGVSGRLYRRYRDENRASYNQRIAALPPPIEGGTEEKTWYQTFKGRTYIVMGCLALVFYMLLRICTLWSDWVQLILTVMLAVGAYFYAQAMDERSKEYAAQDSQKQLPVGVHHTKPLDGKLMIFIGPRLLQQLAFIHMSKSRIIYFASRSSWVHLIRRIWVHLLVTLGIFVTMRAVSAWIGVAEATYLWALEIIVLVPMLHQGIKWYYWVVVMTDEYLHTVRRPPVWLPWMNVINASVPMSMIVKSQGVNLHWWTNMLRYGTVITQIKDAALAYDGKGRAADVMRRALLALCELKYIRYRMTLAFLINEEAKREDEEAQNRAAADAEARRQQAQDIADKQAADDDRRAKQAHDDAEKIKQELAETRRILQEFLESSIRQPPPPWRHTVVVDADQDPNSDTNPFLPVIRE